MDLLPPPSNVPVEQALLGAILLNNRVFERVGDKLRAEHFSDLTNATIYAAVSDLLSSGKGADTVAVCAALPTTDRRYIVGLGRAAIGGSPTEYADIIYDTFLRRQMIETAESMIQEAHGSVPAKDQIEATEQRLFDLTGAGSEEGLVDLDVAVKEAVQSAEAAHKRKGLLAGVPTGLRDLDEKLGGMHPSDLLILAGRPSMGKTSLALTITFNAAAARHPVAFFSLEMDRSQLAGRLLAQKASLSGHELRTGRVGHQDFQRIYDAESALQGLPVFIDHAPSPTVMAIRNRCRRLQRSKGLELIVIDYLQLMSPGRAENRVQEISGITRGLKALAKDMNVPVLALSQLSRAVEQREDKRPQLSDLRESGTIEQDSDAVMFCFREEYYLERQEPRDETKRMDWQMDIARCRNTAEIIIGKQRHGPCGVVVAHFNPEQTWFSDLQR